MAQHEEAKEKGIESNCFLQLPHGQRRQGSISPEVHSKRTGISGHKLQQDILQLDKMNKFFVMRMAKEWNRSLREAVGAPPWHVWRGYRQGPESPNVTLTLFVSVNLLLLAGCGAS